MAEPVDVLPVEQPQQSDEELARMYEEAMQLRRSDPSSAVALLKAVLAGRVAKHGQMALECASAYMQYGMAIFEQAQSSADVFGETVRQAADEKAQQVVDEELADEAGKEEDAAAADTTAAADTAAAEDTATAEAPSSTAAAAEEAAAAEGASAEDAPAPGSASEGEPAEDAAAEGQEGEDADEADDMQLAWENLEVARIIYEREGATQQYASEVADIHNFTGDIFCEQEKWEEAIQEYHKCAAALEAIPGQPDARRTAEVYFKLSLALQYNDQAQEALQAATTAKAKLQAYLDVLTAQLAATPGAPASTTPAADAAFNALAAAVASYAAPAAPATAANPAEDSEQAKKIKGLQEEVSEIRAVLTDLNDKVEELQQIVDSHTSMRDALRQAMQALAAVEGAAGGEAGPVQDLGVVGKGKRVAPVPAEQPPPAAAAEAATRPKRSLEDLMGGPAPGGTTSIGFGTSKTNVTAAAAAAPAGSGAAAPAAAKKIKAAEAAQPDGVENQQA